MYVCINYTNTTLVTTANKNITVRSFRYERFGMWVLPEIVVLMPIIWKVWVKNMMAIF